MNPNETHAVQPGGDTQQNKAIAPAQVPALDLAAENAILRLRLAEINERDQQRAADESVISEKMGKGLTRDQATAVIRRQREFDAAKVAARAARIEVIKTALSGRETVAEAVEKVKPRFSADLHPSILRDEVLEVLNLRKAAR
jgi:hypothetical protein